MIHYLNSLSITEKLYESMQPGGNDMRFAAIESNLANYTKNYAAWHWHEYVEFAYVVEGAVDCLTPRHSLTLHSGEGYFVNANVLHMNRIASGFDTAIFRILQFDPVLLACAGVIARKYVQPIEKATGLECVAFPGQAVILSDMQGLFNVAAMEPKGYEIDILRLLFQLWGHLYIAVEDQISASAAQDNQATRIKTMLAFIHSHYSDPISVADIAAAANISEREAYRTFQQVLGLAPGAYLQQHRIGCASRMLTETSKAVTEIGMACGFSSPNYFSMAFREVMGVSPREFRKGSGTWIKKSPSRKGEKPARG